MKSKSTIFSKHLSNSIAARPCVTILLAFGGALAFSSIGLAGTAKWTGAGTAPSPELGVIWSDNGNWDIPPVTGDDLLFAGSVNLTNWNNLGTAGSYSTDTTPVFTPPAITANSITFDPVSDGFVISGNDIFFNGKTITNNSPNLQTLNLKLQENGNGFTAGGTGDLYLSGLVTNSFSRVFTKNGTGTVTVDGTFDYTGAGGASGSPLQLTVNAGKLVYRGGIFGTVNVGNATTGAALESNGATWHFNTNLKLNNAASSVGFTVNTGFAELDAVAGSVIKGLAQGGTIIIDLNQGQDRICDIAGNLADGDQGGRLGLLLGPNAGIPLVNLSGQNTYTGNTEVRTAGSKLNLLSGGQLTFKIEPDGVSNKIFGPGAVSLDGALAIDLSSAGAPVVGAKWSLVESPNVTYGPNFSVAGFSETAVGSGIWKKIDGAKTWYFTKVSGKLGFGVQPESVWDGDSGGVWSVGGNWTSGAAPITGDSPVFTGSNVTNNNDLATAWDTVNAAPGAVQLAGLRFDAAAASFNLTGNEIYLNSGTIENLSAAPQTISAPIGAGTNGFTVATSAGNVVLAGSLNNYSAANRALIKNGTGTLVLNGTQTQSWALNVNAGTTQVSSPVAAGIPAGSGGTVASGATLKTETGDAITANGIVTLNGGTLDLSGSGEAFGGVAGSGIVTNHGSGGIAPLSFQRNTLTWDGSIRNGGSTTSVAFTGTTTGTDTVTFSGTNTYTGNTTVGADASFTLTNTGSLLFAPGANGVSNKITGDQTAGTGFVKLDGALKLDLSAANTTNGNSWPLVDVGTLKNTFGTTFKVSDASVVSPFGYKVNGGNNAVGAFVATGTFATATTGTITNFARTNAIDVTAVTDPAPQGVYQTEFYLNTPTVGAALTYTFPGLHAGGNYKIRLHFAELFQTAVGTRKFDVAINGNVVLDDYDLIAVTGARYKAVVNEFTVPADSNGAIVIDFIKVVENPKINGIEIIDLSSASTDFVKSGTTWTRANGSKTWTFSETNGVLSLANSGSGDTGFTSWIKDFGLAPADQDPGDDPDHDGLNNLLEYALDGLDPSKADKTPGTMVGNTLSYTKRAIATDVTYAIESSTDLGGTDDWTPVVPTVNNPTTISYTFPHVVARDFARLKVGK